jgi:hypothetical protein
MEVDGQSACLVWPSEDQLARLDASVVIKYPQPVEIQGERYSVLELFADKDYILEIIQSLQFISSVGHNSPYSLSITPQNAKEPQGAKWKAGTPFYVVLTMENRTSEVFHIALTDSALKYRCMSLPKQEPVRVTARFNNVGNASTGNSLITLSPQGSFQRVVEINFLVDRPPGEYSLQLEQVLPQELGKGIVVSNTIQVTVTE